MIKSKSLHIALFVCIFSFSMDAQVFMSGDDAKAALSIEASDVRTQIVDAMATGNFSTDEEYIQQVPEASSSFLLLNVLTDFPITASDSAADVELAFANFVTVINNIYPADEVTMLREELHKILTQ